MTIHDSTARFAVPVHLSTVYSICPSTYASSIFIVATPADEFRAGSLGWGATMVAQELERRQQYSKRKRSIAEAYHQRASRGEETSDPPAVTFWLP
ncbi:hypothetical protein ColTof4_04933 [Colletotrichum tofieldiae]|nr:hypothetical protein ColTof3_10820 [Colletotrichum tofieldiae]GKT72510.1 hypothetical protein ColTof4_04933 [Colletotrichum tofieldiae]